jgi:hypothetical protein
MFDKLIEEQLGGSKVKITEIYNDVLNDKILWYKRIIVSIY